MCLWYVQFCFTSTQFGHYPKVKALNSFKNTNCLFQTFSKETASKIKKPHVLKIDNRMTFGYPKCLVLNICLREKFHNWSTFDVDAKHKSTEVTLVIGSESPTLRVLDIVMASTKSRLSEFSMPWTLLWQRTCWKVILYERSKVSVSDI